MCKVMQDLIDDALVEKTIKLIQMLMTDFGCSFEDAFEKADIDDNIAPAVLQAFGRKPM